MTTVKKSMAFLLGFSVALLPSWGPFFAILLFFSDYAKFRRSDLIWLLTAFLSGASFAYYQGLKGFVFGLFQILGPWLIYRAPTSAKLGKLLPNAFVTGIGIISGFIVLVLVGGLQIDSINFAYKTLGQAITWSASPALFGHTVLVIGGLIALLFPYAPIKLMALAIAALGILVSGSREAAIAWVFIALVVFLGSSQKRWYHRSFELALLTVMLVLAAGLGSLLGWGNMGFLVDLAPSSQSRNLIQGSEIARGDWWDKNWVVVESSVEEIGGSSYTVYELSKKSSENWLRLQQVVPIYPGIVYTASTWLKAESDSQPGIQGWGQDLDQVRTFSLIARLEGQTWKATSNGPGRILQSGVLAKEGDWLRVFATFIYEGQTAPLYWYVGLAPDYRNVMGGSSYFAGFQLEQSAVASAYEAGTATKGLGLGLARVPYWQVAWQGIKEQAWLGHGPGSFPDYYQTHLFNQAKVRDTPAHVHNLVLHVLFERGLFGLLSLMLFLIILLTGAIRQRDHAFSLILSAIFFINIFDVSLYHSGVIYPLVLAAGWRLAVVEKTSAILAVNQMWVRFVLLLGDFLGAYAAYSLAVFLTATSSSGVFSVVTYAMFLWPAMVWRENLYPGYGLTPSQELKKHVTATMYAGLILAAGTFLFSTDLPIPKLTLLITVGLSAVFLPLTRAFTKRILQALGSWGSPVVIFGADALGQQIVKFLLANSLEGLRPVAVFDNRQMRSPKMIHTVPVEGSFADAEAYAKLHNIRHAIVALPQASPDLLKSIFHLNAKVFQKMQFVPQIAGLPVFGVNASSLDKFLALEVRNELAAPLNRSVKRCIDIVAVSLGSLIISPFLLLLALAIYIDSPGPIFYGHKRIGRSGKTFKAWKFRTMVPNAQELLHRYLAENPALQAEWETNQKLQDDPRVTRLGKLLRKYSLDEFPQLWNVLLGDMSLVGPRPIIDEEVCKYGDAFELYTQVRPGMTGYWQVSGRSDTDYVQRVELDSFYVRNWSVWLDIIILFQTPEVVIKGEGAY